MTDETAAGVADANNKQGNIGIYGWYVIFVLMLCQTLSTVDARLPFILVEALKTDLNLSDTQIGLITGPAYSLTFAIFALPIAKMSDRYVRKHVITIAIIAWSACTAAGGLSRGVASFGLSRIGVAIGESALTPAAHSIMASYTTPTSRPTAMAIYALGIAIGSFVALALGGWISDTYGWRAALFFVGVGGVVLAILVSASIKEPGRKADSTAKDLPKSSFKSILGHSAMRNIILGGALMGLSSGALTAWAPSYIIRTFHLSATETGATFGGLSALLGIAGLLMGGLGASWLAKRRQGDAFRMLAIGFVIAAFAQLGSFVVRDYTMFLALTATSTLFVAAYFAPTYAGVQSLADPGARSFAAAVTLFAVNGVGIASGAFFAGLLSDLFKPIAGAESLRWSLLALTSMKFFAALPYWAAARAIDKLEQRSNTAGGAALD